MTTLTLLLGQMPAMQSQPQLAEALCESGYDAAPCPSCCAGAPSGGDRSGCGNCGGSGRLWASPRGSLSDDGLQRLRRMLVRDGAGEERS